MFLKLIYIFNDFLVLLTTLLKSYDSGVLSSGFVLNFLGEVIYVECRKVKAAII